jgi:hypothetical protein
VDRKSHLSNPPPTGRQFNRGPADHRRAEARKRVKRQRRIGLIAVVLAAVAIAWIITAQITGGEKNPPVVAPPPSAAASAVPATNTSPPAAAATTPPAVSTPATTTDSGDVNGALIVDDLIPFSAKRRAQAAAYSQRHYGIRSAALYPKVIVLHFTETDSYRSVWNAFAANTPAPGPAGTSPEPPGTCAHFVIEQDGTIHRLVPVTLQCRHTIGLNRWAIGIEIVQATHGNTSHWADQQILNRPAQIDAALNLVRSLQRQYDIPTTSVIGHATANDSPLFTDLAGWRNDHTDWQPQDVTEFRRRLAH